MLRAKYNTVERESVPAFSPLRRRRIIDIIRGNDVQSLSPDADCTNFLPSQCSKIIREIVLKQEPGKSQLITS